MSVRFSMIAGGATDDLTTQPPMCTCTQLYMYITWCPALSQKDRPGTRLTCIGRERDIDTTDMHGRLIQPPSRACLTSVLEAPVQ